MRKKLIGVVAATTMAILATVSAASAQDYPPAGDEIRAVDNPTLTYTPGGPAIFEAECFLPGSTVTFSLGDTVLGTAVADADGLATITTTIPADTPIGPASVEATGTGCDGDALTLVLSITIVASQVTTTTPQPLPRTGSSTTLPMAQIAVATIVAGGFLVVMANRRRQALATVKHQQRG